MEYRVRDSAASRFLSRAARANHSARPSVACGALPSGTGDAGRAVAVRAPGPVAAAGPPAAARIGSAVGAAPRESGGAVAAAGGALVGAAYVGAAAARSGEEVTDPERKKRTAPTTTTRMASSHPNPVPGPTPERPGGVSISGSAGAES